MINIQEHRRKQTLAEEQIRNNTDIFYPKLLNVRNILGILESIHNARNIFICTPTMLTLAENHQHYYDISLQHQWKTLGFVLKVYPLVFILLIRHILHQHMFCMFYPLHLLVLTCLFLSLHPSHDFFADKFELGCTGWEEDLTWNKRKDKTFITESSAILIINEIPF